MKLLAKIDEIYSFSFCNLSRSTYPIHQKTANGFRWVTYTNLADFLRNSQGLTNKIGKIKPMGRKRQIIKFYLVGWQAE